MGYYVVDKQRGREAYNRLSASEQLSPEDFVERKGGGDSIIGDLVSDDELRIYIEEYEGSTRRDADGLFEGQVGVWLHERIQDHDCVHDPGYWRYLSLIALSDLVLVRHGGGGHGMPKAANYGLESLNEGFLRRAWFRAELGFDPDALPGKRYARALVGDQDFWRSFVIRVGYHYDRAFIRAFVRFQYPTDGHPGLLVKGQKDDGVRMLAKKLRALNANVSYAMLLEEECLNLIREQAVGLTMQSGEAFTIVGAT